MNEEISEKEAIRSFEQQGFLGTGVSLSRVVSGVDWCNIASACEDDNKSIKSLRSSFRHTTPGQTNSEDKAILDEPAEEQTEGPTYLDGGYGWIIVLGTFFCYFLLPGLIRSYGVLYLEIMEAFPNSSATKASWIPALLATTIVGLAPVAGYLSERFSVRITMFIGGVLSSTGLCLGFFTTSVEYLFFTFGIITGTGASLCVTPGILLTAQYFKNKRALANGLCLSGTSVGTFVLPLLVEYFCEWFTFRGAFLIMGGLTMNLCAISILFIPPQPTRRKKEPKVITEQTEMLPVHETKQQRSVVILNRTASVCSNASSTSSIGGLFMKTTKDSERRRSSHHEFGTEMKLMRNGSAEHSKLPPPNKKELTNNNVTMKVPAEKHVQLPPETKKKRKPFLDFSLLKNPVFLVTVISSACMGIGVPHFLFFLPAYAKQTGIDKANAALLLSYCAVCDFCGRVGYGWIADKNYCTRIHGFVFNLLLTSFSSLFLPICSQYWWMALCSAMYGFGSGAGFMLIAVLLADNHGAHNLPSSLGILRFFQACTSVVSAPVSGSLRDATGNFESCFYFMGTFLFASAIIMLLAPCAERRQNERVAAAKLPA